MEEKNYLDIAATAEQVKKSIEEVVEALTSDILENNNKVFTLEVDTENLTEDNFLDSVGIKLKTVRAIAPIEVSLGEMPIGDGYNWLKKSYLYSSFFPTGDASNGAYTEVRLGPDMINEPRIPYPNGQIGYNISRLVLSGNPLAVEDTTSTSTSLDTRIKANDAKTFKLTLAEQANVLFEDSSKVSFKDNSNFSVDSKGLHFAADNSNWGKNRFTLTDGANMDVTGDVSGSPQVYIHGKCFLNLDRGYDPYYKRYNYTGNNAVVPSIEGATIAMHDKAMLAMSEGAYVTASDMAKAYFQGSSLLQMNDSAQVHFTGEAYFMATGASKTYFENNSELYMQGGKMYMNGGTVTMNGHGFEYQPCINMNGGGTILFNSADTGGFGTTPGSSDPLILLNPASLIFVGQGAKGTGAHGDPQLDGTGNWFGYKNLIPANRNPRVQIADETEIIVDAANGYGANWIKIGASEGGLVHISLTGNIFQQMNGNAHFDMSDATHFEMHQGATVLMTGGAYAEMRDSTRLIMRGVSKTNPWKDGATANSAKRVLPRPVSSGGSAILGMYDVAQFTMRGVWDTDDDWTVNKTGVTLANWDTTLSIPTSIEELPEEFKEKLITGTTTKIRDYKDEDGNILTTFTLTGTNLKVTNYEYSTKPLDWNEHLDKIEDQPVVEIIENADVRIYGNSELKLTDYSIIANSEGFTFKDNTIGEEVSFSMSELKELKKLLTGATITE